MELLSMGFGDGVRVALFVMAMVFALLAAVYGLITLTSAVIRSFGKTSKR